MANFKEQYQKQKNKSPYVFNEKGEITSNFSYNDGYVLWLESKINDLKDNSKISLTEEEKRKFKITSISDNQLNFEIEGFKILEIYNYKDGDFSIKMEDENDSIEVLLNEFQIDIIKKFLIV